MVRSVCVRGKHIYALTMSTIHFQDFGLVDVYGISISGQGKTASIKDISSDYSAVHYLYKEIVKGNLHPEHLADVVEDFLSDSFSKVIPLDLQMDKSVVA